MALFPISILFLSCSLILSSVSRASGECLAHPEHLLVQCTAVNETTLSQQLSHVLRTALWVYELKITKSDLPEVSEIIPRNMPGMPHLQSLHILRSQVTQVTVEALMKVASSIRHFSLAHNRLVGVPASVTLLENLEELDLRHNAITKIPALLSRLPRLRTVKLDHNRIRQLTGWGVELSPLTHLSVADNLIHEVWSGALESLPALQNLDLRGNSLQRLPSTLKFTRSLFEVDLRNNPWHCDCGSFWLARLQHRRQGRHQSLILSLPQCSSPEHLRGQSLSGLTEEDLCRIDGRTNFSRSLENDLDNRQINLTSIGSRYFELSWNVSELSYKGQKVQEYLGWRVTFRPFGEVKESEVLLISLSGEGVRRQSKSTSGKYKIRNLQPDTGYHLCFETLSDGEVNNIIESRKRTQTSRISPQEPDKIRDPTARESGGRSIDRGLPVNQNPALRIRQNLNPFFRDNFNPFIKPTTDADETVTPTTAIPDEYTTQKPPAQNFVYTSDGKRIPINFAPPGVPLNSPSVPVRNDFDSDDYFDQDQNQPQPRIPSVIPPPPPPINFGESGSPVSFPFIRRKRSITTENTDSSSNKRCLEIVTEAEDEIAMPVTVAATASSSTTLVIFMICCCCFPKRCNKMRDCCIDKCKSVKDKTLIKTNSKTKTFVKPPKKQEVLYKPGNSVSTPDLRLLDKGDEIEKEYRYQNLNKYYTMRVKNVDDSIIEFYPGYDFPKTTTAKYFGYDFPKTTIYSKLPTTPTDLKSPRRMSTDDNTSPINNDRFIYYNLNKVKANLDIPVDHCKYSNKIKGLKIANLPNRKLSKDEFTYKLSPLDSRKILNEHHSPKSLRQNVHNNLERIRSHSESDLPSLLEENKLRQPLYYNLLSKFTKPDSNAMTNPTYNLPMSARNIAQPQEIRLELVKEVDHGGPRRPTLLNLTPKNEHPMDSHQMYHSLPYSETDNTLQMNGNHGNGVPKSPVPVGEIAISGGTLVEVPEGYVTPAKPRPINILTIQVPADGGYV